MPRPDDGGDAVVKGCRFPMRLYYDVPNHMWYEPQPGSLVRVGMTIVAAALADNRIFAFTPKRVGRDLEKGRSCATVESSKWAGPARIAFDGIVEAINEELMDRPDLLVTDPYEAGWMLLARPTAENALAALVSGAAVAEAYSRWMDDNDFPGCQAQGA